MSYCIELDKALRYAMHEHLPGLTSTAHQLMQRLTDPSDPEMRQERLFGDHTGWRGITADALEEADRHEDAELLRKPGPVAIESWTAHHPETGPYRNYRVVPFELKHVGPMTRAYLEAALWAGDDWRAVDRGEEDNPEPLDRHFILPDIHPDTLAEAEHHCRQFYEGLPEHLKGAIAGDPEQAGHDFYLTRNGHGAGFDDGHWDQMGSEHDYGRELTEHARKHREWELEPDEEGNLHGRHG